MMLKVFTFICDECGKTKEVWAFDGKKKYPRCCGKKMREKYNPLPFNFKNWTRQ